MHRASWLLVAGLCAAACGGGSSSGSEGGSGASAGSGATSGGGSSNGGSTTDGSCTAQVQTGTRTECDFSQGISDPDIACDDVPVYGNVPGITCSGSCVDPKTTNGHCGECGNACESGEYCKEGDCTPYGSGAGGSGAGGSGGNGATSGSGGSLPQVPDLTVTNFSLSRTVDAAGECANGVCSHEVRVCLDILKNNVVEISNLGFGPSPAVTVGIGFEDADQELHPCALESPLVSPPLASLEKWTKSDAFCCTANLRLPGQYRLSIIADPDDEIAEYDENNNAGYTDLATISAP